MARADGVTGTPTAVGRPSRSGGWRRLAVAVRASVAVAVPVARGAVAAAGAARRRPRASRRWPGAVARRGPGGWSAVTVGAGRGVVRADPGGGRARWPGCSPASGSGAAALLRTVATVPFVLPTVVIGAPRSPRCSGPRGLVDARGTWWAILAAHLCFNLAVVLRTVGAAARLGRPRPGAARPGSLGATPVGAARRRACCRRWPRRSPRRRSSCSCSA